MAVGEMTDEYNPLPPPLDPHPFDPIFTIAPRELGEPRMSRGRASLLL